MRRKYAAVGIAVVALLLAWFVVAQEPEDAPGDAPGEVAPEVPAESPVDAMKLRIRAGAEESATALLSGDDARVVELSYPRVVEMLGGRDAMLDVMAQGRRYMDEQGLEMLAYTVETVSETFSAGDELHAVVRTLQKVKIPVGTMTQPGFLLAVSGDGGQTWHYIDGAQLTPETVLEVVPAFNDALELPTLLEPTLESDSD